ncbi:phosphoenolpyruvate-protein phosphotransferase PtsI [Candidatus Purcelliella pentastirinorum]|uniref:Phosphoenolpyruvate-protein phosphotransferase n=1 Tax=Candidatus Purcelliella pentastirinorum TaxID=472834 RepID=A0AAX3N9Q5_9ENTR|nr:phosphoenolpyruvate-protein phosphotransferase PtsI [Candidatus Purcelliella pentastirinorum]WDI78595.1 phosphoenolpyruvate-protein phosphotransferase PtsI [Candidatus Purcelliella pentastirinorum]WDR80377.1 phosphoenolpyruvate-protein phosphotransferase PtsI [Candidatus Purcelliella pentastirinorum]
MNSGILASQGLAFGKALLYKEDKIIVNYNKISINEVNKEIKRFIDARHKSIVQLKSILKKADELFGKKKSVIFAGHILLLEDVELEQEIITLIKKSNFTADAAIFSVMNDQIIALKGINDIYLKERIIDIHDISKRLLHNVLELEVIDLSLIKDKVILIAKDLTPSLIAQFDTKVVIGLLTDLGGSTSHTSIIARSLGLPAIVGLGNITSKIKTGDVVILDGINNKFYINPSFNVINEFKLLRRKFFLEKNRLKKIKDLTAITLDGHKVEISVNINKIDDVKNVFSSGGESIGLYRTEFLFMNRSSLPDEEEQFLVYKDIAKFMNNKPVIIRTMDIGGDKYISYLNFPKEENPFLGWRAIRIMMDRKDILYSQIRAILRASYFGKLYIMFPMIISLEEVLFLKNEINKIKDKLFNDGYSFDNNIKIGVMIETPSAAIISNYLAKEVDFFSIGTNDLTQYTLAVDRGNDSISHLYNPFSPAVLRLIERVINYSHVEGKWTSVCGELASNQNAIVLLLGMGLDKFSVNITSVANVKRIIRNTDFFKAKKLVKNVLSESTVKGIMYLLDEFIKENNILNI